LGKTATAIFGIAGPLTGNLDAWDQADMWQENAWNIIPLRRGTHTIEYKQMPFFRKMLDDRFRDAEKNEALGVWEKRYVEKMTHDLLAGRLGNRDQVQRILSNSQGLAGKKLENLVYRCPEAVYLQAILEKLTENERKFFAEKAKKEVTPQIVAELKNLSLPYGERFWGVSYFSEKKVSKGRDAVLQVYDFVQTNKDALWKIPNIEAIQKMIADNEGEIDEFIEYYKKYEPSGKALNPFYEIRKFGNDFYKKKIDLKSTAGNQQIQIDIINGRILDEIQNHAHVAILEAREKIGNLDPKEKLALQIEDLVSYLKGLNFDEDEIEKIENNLTNGVYDDLRDNLRDVKSSIIDLVQQAAIDEALETIDRVTDVVEETEINTIIAGIEGELDFEHYKIYKAALAFVPFQYKNEIKDFITTLNGL
jgi:hypothetical protein